MVEGLEERRVLSTITWGATGGGSWELASNWVGGVVPTAADDVIITKLKTAGTITLSNSGDAANSITTDNTAQLQFNANTFALGAGASTFGANVTIVSGATVSVAAGATIALGTGSGAASIADRGTLTLGSGAAITFAVANETIAVGGTLGLTAGNISSAAANPPLTGNTIAVSSGGHLTATNSTFGVNAVVLGDGTVLNQGDLTGNVFNAALDLPATDVPLVANNKSFGGGINLLAGTLGTGQSLSLTAIGTASPVGGYGFLGNFTVAPGALLAVDPGLGLTGSSTLTIQGTLNLGQGDSYGFTGGSIVVNGNLNITGGRFYNILPPGTTMPPGPPSSLTVNANGHLKATGTTFGDGKALLTTTINDGAVLNAGDLAGDDFLKTLLILPATDVPLVTNNVEFGEVDLLPGNLPANQNLELTLMGTGSTSSLFYVFTGPFTVNTGATLTLDPGLTVNLSNTTLTDNGTLNFGSNDLITFTTAGMIVVNGTMNATTTSFVNSPNVLAATATTAIVVNSGGHLTGAHNIISPTQTTLNNGTVLNAGDLTDNNFGNTVLSLPAIDVPLVTSNRQFAEVDLLGGTLASGNLTLPAMGTATTSTLLYKFVGNYTVAGGATLTVAPNLAVTVAATLTADATAASNGPPATPASQGTINFAHGDVVTLATGGSIVVNGVVSVPSATITGGGPITVNSGGRLTAIGATLTPAALNLNAGSTANLTVSTFGTAINVNSAANLTFRNNNLTNVGANGVTAAGDANAHIDMTGNYWGSADPATVPAKILDHNDDMTRPTVDYLPIVGGVAGIFATSVTTTYSTASQKLTLTAAVISGNTNVNEGTVTFSIYTNDGSTLIGQAVTTNAANGLASATYTLPAGTARGLYLVQAEYNGTSNYLANIDAAHTLTVNQAPVTVTGPTGGSSATYNANNSQAIPFAATVTDANGAAVTEGSVVFTVFNGTTQVGTAVTAPVTNGKASGTYTLPAGTAGGTYTVQEMFGGSADYQSKTGTPFTLTVNAAPSTTQATSIAATYTASSRVITISAAVTSTGGTVNEGSVVFTIMNGTTTVGTAVTATVANGTASGTYTLPAGTAAGTYTISAAYGGTADYATSTDTTHTLTISKAGTTIEGQAASTPYSSATHTVQLTASLTSGSGTVTGGTVTFKVLNGSTLIGTATTATVTAGSATAAYTLPGGLAAGTSYTIEADYGGTTNLAASTDSTAKLQVVQAQPTVAATTDAGTYSPTSESITAHASVVNGATNVTEGSVTFQVYSGTTAVGSPVTVAVANGAATATLTLPGGTMVGTADTVRASFGGSNNYLTGSATASITLNKATPTVSFAPPAGLVFGQALSATQLDAAASVPGAFAYSPAVGTILNAGTGQTLIAAFTPTDTTDYNAATASTTIDVAQATPTFSGLSATEAVQFGQPTVVINGKLIAPTAIPVGAQVQIIIGGGANITTATATVTSDGSFSATASVGMFPVGTYPVQYQFGGTANFAAATAGGPGSSGGSTTLTVSQASQVITTFDAPTTAVYGQAFHVSLASSGNTLVVLAATNATVAPAAGGGYTVTLTSGSTDAVLTAYAVGTANYIQSPARSLTVHAQKATATLSISQTGIYYTGLPIPVSVVTNPGGLKVAVGYTLNGTLAPVPITMGNYIAYATIQDANYQGTATSLVTILGPLGGGATTPTPTPTTPVVGPVAVSGVSVTTNRQGAVTAVNITFTGALNVASANHLGNYRLALAGAGGSFDAPNARALRIRSAFYHQDSRTVTLTLQQPFRRTQALQVRVYGQANRGLFGAHGLLIDGDHNGTVGGNENAIITRNGITF